MCEILKHLHATTYIFLVLSLFVFTTSEPESIRCDDSDETTVFIEYGGIVFKSKCPNNKICDNTALSSNYCVDRKNATTTISPVTMDITTTTSTTTVKDISTSKISTVTATSTTPSSIPLIPPPNYYQKCNDGFGKTNPCRIDPADSSYYIKCKFQFFDYFVPERRLCSDLKNDEDCKNKTVCQTA